MTNPILKTDIESFKMDVKTALDMDEPVFGWGPSGIGKSEGIEQVAEERNATLCDIRLSTFDPVDLRGMPYVVEQFTHWARPAIWPTDTTKEIILFFDEMDRAGPAVSNAALQIVLQKKIGEHVLPSNVRIVAAGNGSHDRVGTNKISSAQANRFTHLYVTASAIGTAQHLAAKGANPIGVAFLRFRPELITTTAAKDKHAFASPRAWEKAFKYLALPKEQQYRMISGAVGVAECGELLAFADIVNQLPKPAEIEANPRSAILPVSPSACYAVASMIGGTANKQNVGAFVTYARRLDPEFQTMAIVDMTKRDKSLAETQAVIEWNVDNQDVTL